MERQMHMRQQNLKHERDLIKTSPTSSVDNKGVRGTPASGSFDSAKTNTLLTTETSVGSKDQMHMRAIKLMYGPTQDTSS
jgi:hypothetical protein